MSSADVRAQSVAWGQAFEVLVKRGALSCLADAGLLRTDHRVFQEWSSLRVDDIYRALVAQLDVVDEAMIERLRGAARHLATLSYGLGYTTVREYLHHVGKRRPGGARLELRALFCPLNLPGARDRDAELERNRAALHDSLGLPDSMDWDVSSRGRPANADLLVWLSDGARDGKEHVLVQEYSYHFFGDVGDFTREDAHLNALLRHRRLVDARGVFARITAEVNDEGFELCDDICSHLTALSAEDKPFFKLCQAAAYAESTVKLLATTGRLKRPCVTRAMAVTPSGIESLAALYRGRDGGDTRFKLLEKLANAYRSATKIPDDDRRGLEREVEAVFNGLLRRLPEPLYRELQQLAVSPRVGDDLDLRLVERVDGFSSPTRTLLREEALGMIDENSEPLARYFREPPRVAIGRAIRNQPRQGDTISLRDLHAATIGAALEAAQPGVITTLALEGNPGIGKTTAVTQFIGRQSKGCLFLYLSPRVVINRDVTSGLARGERGPTGVMTVTTNSQIIASAERWHRAQVDAGREQRRKVEGAVVVDGLVHLVKPSGPVLVLTPEEEGAIDDFHASTTVRKATLSESEDVVVDRPLMGVLRAMASTAKDLLRLNSAVDRAVLTAAIQGYREHHGGSTTVDALSELFDHEYDRPAGRVERSAFARRMPTIMVMVDEITGDGAGGPFVHALADWLHQEFIAPFEERPSPFTVVLIISDASLSNEQVLVRYLETRERSPDKVLVCESQGQECYRLAAGMIRLGQWPCPVLHVMTNSFPATELTVEYRIRMRPLELQLLESVVESPRQAIRRAWGDALLDSAAGEILRAIAHGARQVIYFAQDRAFLRQLRDEIVQCRDVGLNKDNVAVLDSSVPGFVRQRLIQEATRDRYKVFLMTSSAARGVSFPLTDWIIAAVPRFQIEASLMEIAQLIYRGRGMYTDRGTGEKVSGDDVPRRLVMHIDDFIVDEERSDRRQWLRQASDLLTLLVMLRGTIFTRITGQAGIRRHPLALVPVGRAGTQELKNLMSTQVREFLREAELHISDNGSDAGLVASARANVEALFSRFKLKATAQLGSPVASFVRPERALEFMERTSGPLQPLLAPRDRPSLPPNTYFAGTTVLERWGEFSKREQFMFEGWAFENDKAALGLKHQLFAIDRKPSLPSKLRRPAKSLAVLLEREQEESGKAFTTSKELRSPNLWVALPAMYPQFVRKDASELQRLERWVREPESWNRALAAELGVGDGIMPAIPLYEEFPWAASVGLADPLGLEVVFDDRYFMASSELNLLNTLLLAEERERGSACGEPHSDGPAQREGGPLTDSG